MIVETVSVLDVPQIAGTAGLTSVILAELDINVQHLDDPTRGSKGL